MALRCTFCDIRGQKGFFRYPKDPQQRAECLELAGLPVEADLKVKVENLRVCFRHYEAKAFFFNDGGQLRLKKGKSFKENYFKTQCRHVQIIHVNLTEIFSI